MNILFPEIEVKLSGIDGNAFSILGVVLKALRKGDAGAEAIANFQGEAMSGDYDHLMQTVMKTVSVR
jgi:hypothetical protein